MNNLDYLLVIEKTLVIENISIGFLLCKNNKTV